MRTLVFGGSFNPIHLGHLIMAEEIRQELDFDRVLFVPAALSPFKDGSDDPGPLHRLAMLELALGDNPDFSIDKRELGRAGPSFTIDTIRSLVLEGTVESRPGLLVGDDLLAGLPRWREIAALKVEAGIVVGRRSAGNRGKAATEYRYASNRIIPISSSDIRANVLLKRSIRYLVPELVRAYILEKGLYGSR
ncbi:MAG: nicotinate (nicotinamide) nucleotide adenylyltransferase [Treponema sp.]|nr:nicotinate (nicotinamide) nucleotide adenylyltransferase [Treponema sp.]